jgi:hypothetical protein
MEKNPPSILWEFPLRGGGPGVKGPTRPFTSQKKIQRTPLGSYFFQFYNNL